MPFLNTVKLSQISFIFYILNMEKKTFLKSNNDCYFPGLFQYLIPVSGYK